jgi:hypothetical protein
MCDSHSICHLGLVDITHFCNFIISLLIINVEVIKCIYSVIVTHVQFKFESQTAGRLNMPV